MLNKIIFSSLIVVSSINVMANTNLESDIQSRSDLRFTQDYTVQNFKTNDDLIMTPYVINGTDASIQQFPFYARLTIPQGQDSFFHTCGGSILNEKYILTAAHCVENVDISKYAVIINHDNNNFQYSDFKFVETAHIHPDYNPRNAENDIAILELVDEIQEPITKISIASPNEVVYYNQLEDLTVIGMGQINLDNENPVGADKLQKGVVSLLDDDTCETTTLKKGSEVICATPKKSVDSCFGDSGGPITYLGNNGYRQAGLVSYGLGLTGVCAEDNSLTVYTELAGYAGFIENVTGIKRDINGENDTDEPGFINPANKDSGSFGLGGLIALLGFGFYRRKVSK